MRSYSISPGVALRRLLKNPGFTLPSFLILTLGIGATTGIFTVVGGVLLKPLPLPDSDRLVYLCETHPESLSFCGAASAVNVADLSAAARSFDGLGVSRVHTVMVRDDQGVTSLNGGLVSPGFLDLLGVEPLMGRFFAPDEVGEGNDGAMILSHRLWVERFGRDPDILGKTLDIEGTAAVVIGVMPEGFEVPTQEWAEFWKPLPWNYGDEGMRAWRGFRALGRLADGASIEEGRAELDRLYRGLGETYDVVASPWRVEIQPALVYVVGRSTRRTLYVFLAAVSLLLLIGCLNVANLLLARGTRQERSFAIRHALGAGQANLLAQVMTESLILAVSAGIAGFVLAWWGLRVFLALAPAAIPRLDEVAISPLVVVFVIGLSLVATVLFGTVPALRSSRMSPAQALRTGPSTTDRGGERLRRVLVVVELALSLVLLGAAGLLTRSFLGFLHWDMGFDPVGLNLVQVRTTDDRYPEDEDIVLLWRELERRIAALPDVSGVTTASGVPLWSSPEGTHYRTAAAADVPEVELPNAYFFDVGPGYFSTLGISLVRGREFLESDDAVSTPVAVVNETLARRAWLGEDAIGQRVWASFAGDTLEVVGVAKDLVPLTPGEATRPTVYWSNRQFTRGATLFAVRGRGGSVPDVEGLQEAIAAYDPGLPAYARGTVESLYATQLARPRFDVALVGIFAAAAMILAALGTYAVVAYLAAERYREFGIRIALGSSRGRILRGVLREGVILAVTGTVLGLLGSVASAGLLAGVIHGVPATDLLTLGAVSGLLMGIAILACVLPAVRASKVDPVVLLKAQ